MLVTVMVVFTICWTPILLWDFYAAIKNLYSDDPGWPFSYHTRQMWLRLQSYVNSIVNAAIYYFTSE